MRTWQELEASFQGLAPALAYARVDVQWGAAGVHCRLAGGSPSEARQRFEVLARVAGRRARTHPLLRAEQDVAEAASDFAAWCMALRHRSPAFEFGVIGEQTSADGVHDGFIYTGTIRPAAESSASLCLALEADAIEQGDRRAYEFAVVAGASVHLDRAYATLESGAPEWAVVAREAVSALEAVVKLRASGPDATLGYCMEQLCRAGVLHPALAKSLDGIWGFSNQSPGIRHGSPEVPTITAGEARFVLSVCEAAIELLTPAV